jgi:hypothetical protein
MSATWSAISMPPNLPPPAVCMPGEAFETSTVNFEPLHERRREVRYPTYEEVQVALLDLPGLDVSGVLRDVSRSGFRLELCLPVRTGARVKISIRDKEVIFATARYCRAEGETFQVGASIDAMFCPSALQAARKPGLNAGPAAGECGDLARAIIDDHQSFPGGCSKPLANNPFASERRV